MSCPAALTATQSSSTARLAGVAASTPSPGRQAVVNSRLVQIDPNNPGWPTVPGSLRDADWQGGNETQISGYQAPDGWVYIVADGFARDHTVRLYHCHAETFTDRNTWW